MSASSIQAILKNNIIVRDNALNKYFRKDKYAFGEALDDVYERPTEDPILTARLKKANSLRKRKEFRFLFILIVLFAVSSLFAIGLLKGVIQLPQMNLWFDSVFGTV